MMSETSAIVFSARARARSPPLRRMASIWAVSSISRARTRDLLWRLVVTTVSSCLRYRVTGLAAEAAFFAILSVPPLVFALAGAIGYATDQLDPGQIDDIRDAIRKSHPTL